MQLRVLIIQLRVLIIQLRVLIMQQNFSTMIGMEGILRNFQSKGILKFYSKNAKQQPI